MAKRVAIGIQNFADLRMKDCFYIDKTKFIREWWDSEDSVTLITRPRRFGKSYAARMLCAYYDRTCDSHKLFEKLKISKDISYEEHINKYNVIYLDVASFMSELKRQKHSIKDVAERAFNSGHSCLHIILVIYACGLFL